MSGRTDKADLGAAESDTPTPVKAEAVVESPDAGESPDPQARSEGRGSEQTARTLSEVGVLLFHQCTFAVVRPTEQIVPAVHLVLLPDDHKKIEESNWWPALALTSREAADALIENLRARLDEVFPEGAADGD